MGFEETPAIAGYASVAGKLESQGPLGNDFDKIIYDSYNGLQSFEQAESRLQTEAVAQAIKKSGVSAEELTLFLQATC